MKYLPALFTLAAALSMAVPTTGWSRDRNDDRRHSHHRHSSSHSHHHHRSPSVYYRSYRPYGYAYSPSFYSGYPYGYSSYPYYSRPAIGLSFSSGPSYASYSRASSSIGYDGDLAEDVQRALARRGYYRGEIDGAVGPGTRGAIRSYQNRNRLEVTGRIDRSLLRSLGLA